MRKDEGAASSERPGVGLSALLVETTAVQALGTLAVLTIPALAPIVAVALDVPASYVGYQVAMVYLAAMLTSICAGACIQHFGPCRTGQIAMLLNAAGCLLESIPRIGTLVLGSIAIGIGYGLINPAASDILMRHGPPERRNLIFSVKQTGVPIGGMIAGLVAPTAAIAFGWQTAMWCIAVCSAVAAVASQPTRAALDRYRDGPSKPSTFPLRVLLSVMTTPALRWLILSSLCFNAIQLSMIAFMVVLLVEDLHYDLVTAGMILGLVQIAGALGRLVWGYVADLLRDGLGVLFGIGVAIAVGSSVIAFGGNGLPAWVPIATFVILGATAVGWNGVYLSEMARLSPTGAVGATTGAGMFFTFTGVLIGPTLLSSGHAVIGSYVGSYTILAAIALLSIVMLTLVRWR